MKDWYKRTREELEQQLRVAEREIHRATSYAGHARAISDYKKLKAMFEKGWFDDRSQMAYYNDPKYYQPGYSGYGYPATTSNAITYNWFESSSAAVGPPQRAASPRELTAVDVLRAQVEEICAIGKSSLV